MEVFVEISIIIVATAIIAGIVRLFKQPLIISYIITGIFVGPSMLNIIKSDETIGAFAHIGIALLLFTVGLSLNPKIIKDVGKVSLITGVGQVIFTSIVGFLISMAMGFPIVTSIYIAIALTFSSTIIITKLLSDKGDMKSLYGKISIGFLLIQDLIVIVILMIVPSIAGDFSVMSIMSEVVLKGIGFLIAIFLVGFYILPIITKAAAKSQEFLLLFAISWSLALASFSYYLGLSIEIGAFLAGITLATSPYRYEISSKMRPLRDFFIILFFIMLGSQLVFTDISQYIIPILVFSAFILIGNPVIVMIVMGMLGYTKRTGFMAGLTVAQISEFSLIFVALGVSIGHVTEAVLSIVTSVGLITIAGSTYLILYADKIYPYLSKYLSVFERKGKKVDESENYQDCVYDIILFGYDRIGYDVLETFKKIKKKFLVLDYNPEIIQKLSDDGIRCEYGDADDVELLNELNLGSIKMAVSTIPKLDTNLLLISKIRESNKNAIITVVSHQIDEAMKLYDAGATYVLLPHFLGGYHVSAMIKKHGLDLSKFLEERDSHIENLNKRLKAGHEHPRHEAT